MGCFLCIILAVPRNPTIWDVWACCLFLLHADCDADEPGVGFEKLDNVGMFEHVAYCRLPLQVVQREAGWRRELCHVHHLQQGHKAGQQVGRFTRAGISQSPSVQQGHMTRVESCCEDEGQEGGRGEPWRRTPGRCAGGRTVVPPRKVPSLWSRAPVHQWIVLSLLMKTMMMHCWLQSEPLCFCGRRWGSHGGQVRSTKGWERDWKNCSGIKTGCQLQSIGHYGSP